MQPIRNLLRFLKIDSEVFRSRTPGEPFDGAPHPTLSETVAFAAEMFEGTITDLIAPKKK